MRESAVQSRIRLRASQLGIHLWRNNSGVLLNERGTPVRFGLGNDSSRINDVLKSSDLIGIMPGGVFVAVEVKELDWIGVRSPYERAQENFINLVRQMGGVAGFVRSVQEFDSLVLKGI